MSIKRPVCKLDTSRQRDFFAAVSPSVIKEKIEHKKGRVFRSQDPNEIYIGNQSLKTYLEQTGTKQAFIVKDLLSCQDWSSFEQKYKGGGRAAYLPEAMTGLVLYGMMKGVSSLRDLEQLARIDLGCMWVTGGILPDHSIIGRFIQRHSETLSEDFFVSLTISVLKRTGSGISSVAGDGTIIEAMASRYHLIKKEAAEQWLIESKAGLEKNPEDTKLKANVEQAKMVYKELEKRTKKREEQRKPIDTVTISSVEPEAVIQPSKKGKACVPSYKPSVLANDKRVIVAIHVDPSNEINSLVPMLDMATRTGEGESVKELLLDGGYHAIKVLEESIKRDIHLLCPAGSTIKKNHLD